MSESGDMDALAAEYVLGTLDANERAQAQALLTVDHALAAKVRIWERRLSELHLMVEPIEPEHEIWDRIKRKIPRPTSATPPVPEPVVEPVASVATAAVAAPVTAPAMAAGPEPIPSTPEFVSAGPEPQPAAVVDQPAPVVTRSTLESLEEAVLKAADDLQQRATAKPVAEPADAPPAGSEPAEADGKTAEAVGKTPEQVAESAEKGPKTEETPAPGTTADEEPAPSGVFDDMPEPTPSGPLAAFPTSFTASAPVPSPAPLVPSPPATLSVPVPPPVAAPSPALAVRPGERRKPPAPKSRWLARTIATLATLILLAAAGLVAAWRFAPERVPPQLQPLELLRAAGIATPTVAGPPPRRPAPPESQYDE